MSDIRLKIFYSVAKNLSFTKAAEEICITQPAVTKNIKELESQYGIRLFDRKGNKIGLTDAGKVLFSYAEKIIDIYKQIEYDLDLIKDHFSGTFQIGASTTIGQYVIPSVTSLFHTQYPDIKISLITANTHEIEIALLEKRIELGIVEGKLSSRQLKYMPFMQDEIVVIAHTSQEISMRDTISLDELKKIPLVLREVGSGSLEIIKYELSKHSIQLKDLNISMHLGSTESIKSYLENTNSIGLVSIAAVNKEIRNGEFKIIDVEGLEIKRQFCFVYAQGVPDRISDLFIRFTISLL